MVRRNLFLLALPLLAALAACAAPKRPATLTSVEEVAPPVTWRTTIAPQDRVTLDAFPQRLAGFAARLPAQRRAQGALLDPGAALDHATLPPGAYHCRVLSVARAAIRKGAADFCHVSGEADGLGFVKQTGAAPTAGYLYADGDRYVFLGARQRRAGENALAYGAVRAADIVGVVERIGNFRWRMAVAGATPGQFDLYELTPVPPEQQPRG